MKSLLRLISLLIVVACAPPQRLAIADAPPDFAPAGTKFLERFCLDCHAGEEPEGGLSLADLTSSGRLVERRDATDRIVEMIRFGLMPPEGADLPSSRERDQFVNLIEGTLAHADRHAPVNPGRVTMRRLNRTEYKNSVRYLLGVDIDPAEDFPTDDVGHGFDNIGDVLTLPPVLMERYLAAAERTAARALSTAPLAPPKVVTPAREMLPSDDRTRGIFREIRFAADAHGDPARSGPIYVDYSLPAGAFLLHSRVWADAPADQLVEIAILACSPTPGENAAPPEVVERLSGAGLADLGPFRVLETIKVVSRQGLFPRDIKVSVPEIVGFHRLAVAALQPAEGAAPFSVHIGGFALEGPIRDLPCLFRQQVDRSPDLPERQRTRELLTWLCRRAYRRPTADEEIDRLARLVSDVQAAGGDWEDGVDLALQAVLVSPKFLFRMELDSDPLSANVRPLDEHQLASRLSYFLWSTLPDDELSRLADEGQLHRQLDAQVKRMLQDPRSAALVDNFAMQWLQLKKLDSVAPDRSLFPEFTERLRQAMREETRLFLTAIIEEDRSLLDLLGADFTYLNGTLSRHYGVVDTNGNREGQPPVAPPGTRISGRNFFRVEFPDERSGGLLKQASVLTVTSNPTRTSPVKRGLWVLEQLIGRSPPPPPPNVPELEGNGRQLTGTLRERLEQHRSHPSCASCHAQMDPIGFAFENFDAIGRFRRRDGQAVIDASGTLPGGRGFTGPEELIDILKGRREEFYRCLADRLLTYALGRGLEYYDRPAINRIVEKLAEDNDRFSTLVLAIVHSDPFLKRRGQ